MNEIRLNGTQYKLPPGARIIKRQLNPYRAKLGSSGGLEFSDFGEASLEEYHDFRGGIGLESDLPSESNRISFSEGADVSTPRGAVLGPLITTAGSFGVAPVKIIDFQSGTYAIGTRVIKKWNAGGPSWDVVDSADWRTLEDCEDAWDESTHDGITSTADSGDPQVGSNNVKLAWASDLPQAGEILASEVITSVNLEDSTQIRLYVKKHADNDGVYQLVLDDNANCASPIETIDLTFTSSWVQVTINLANPASDTAIISIGIRCKTSENNANGWIMIDEVQDDQKVVTSPIDALVVQDNTDEYLIVSSASRAKYTTDGSTWTALTDFNGGYMASFAGRLWGISTDGKTVQYSALNDIDDFSDNWTSPTGFNDPDSDWANETFTYDELVKGDFSNASSVSTAGSKILVLTVPAGYYDRIRVYQDRNDQNITIDAFYDGVWTQVYTGTITDDAWVTKTLSTFEYITLIRFQYDGAGGGIYEVDIGNAQQFQLSGDFGTVYGLFEGKLLSDGSPALYFHSNRGLFTIDVDNEKAYQQEVEYPPLTNAGRAGLYWNANVWVATGFGITKVAPSTAVGVGPDRDDGLPSGSQGTIYALETVNNWLVYCVNGGSTDESSILKRNATVGGNLQVYTTSAANKPIPCLLHSPSSLYTNGRLWFGEGTDIKYMMFPDTTHNVKSIATYEYVAASTANHLQLPIFRNLAAISKTALGVAAITKSLNSNEKLTVYYGLNGAAPTTSLGEFATSPRPTILTFGSGLGTEFYRIQLAIKFERDSGTNTNSPELESLIFYYIATPVPIHSWTFPIDASGEDGEATFTAFETIRDTNTLVAFFPSGDPTQTSYNVKLTAMPSREWWENQGRRDGFFEVRVQEIFAG